MNEIETKRKKYKQIMDKCSALLSYDEWIFFTNEAIKLVQDRYWRVFGSFKNTDPLKNGCRTLEEFKYYQGVIHGLEIACNIPQEIKNEAQKQLDRLINQ